DVLPGSARGARILARAACRQRPRAWRGRHRQARSGRAARDQGGADGLFRRAHSAGGNADADAAGGGGGLMLRTNLSTRPFYNVRAVHAALAAAAAVVLLFTLFNAVQIVRLALSQQTLGASAADAEQEAARLRSEAVKIRAQINPQELQVVANEAREANRIIDQRAFSWTELFAQFEATLPPDVRITAVQPRIEENNFVIGVGVEARR